MKIHKPMRAPKETTENRSGRAGAALGIASILLMALIALIALYNLHTIAPLSGSPAQVEQSPAPPVLPAPTSSQEISPATEAASPTLPLSPLANATQTPPAVRAATASTSASTQSLNDHYGISLGTTLLSLDPAALDAELDDLAALHIGWVRMDFDWNSIQPRGPRSYDWSGYDAVVQALVVHHFRILGILDYSAQWAVPAGCSLRCPPQDPAQFADFARAVSMRYAPFGLHDWEVWNEPNMGSSWAPAAEAASYVALLKAAYSALHAADPDAFVVSAGLAPAATDGKNIAPVDFLSLMYALGAKNYFDAVGFHPYSYPVLPSDTDAWNAWYQMGGTSPSLRSVMVDNNDAGKQIWITEYGAPTGGPDGNHVSEEMQARVIAQAITLARAYPWAGPLFIYSYKDLGDSTDTDENFFGLLRYDGTAKPAYEAVRSLLSNAR